MKHYLCGILIIILFIFRPIQIVASSDEEPIVGPIVDQIVEPAVEPEPEPETPSPDPEPAEEPIVEPVEDPVDPIAEPVPIEEPVEDPIVDPVVDPVEVPIVDPVVDPVEVPIEDPVEDPIEEPVEDPIVDPVVDPVEAPIEDPVEDPIEEPVEDPAEDPIEEPIVEPEPVEESVEDPIVEPQPEPLLEILTHQLVISEVMIGSEVNPEKDVWIELFNPTEEEIVLGGWQIRGVTKGGMWIDVTNESDYTIEPDSYFLLSYYTNSSYSALEVKPQMTKSSLFFLEGQIEIELKDPNEQLSDKVVIEHQISDEFRSYERNLPIEDGELSESWVQAALQTNLKEELLNTFATPGSPNSLWPEPIEDLVVGPMEDPIEDPVEDPIEDPVEDPIVEPIPPPPPPSVQYIPPPPPPVPYTPLPPPPPPLQQVVFYPTYQLISEFMVNPEGADTEGEWIELFNSTSNTIDISGWYLDDAPGNSSPYRIPDNTYLAPNAYLVISEPSLKLSLKNSDDLVRLLDPNKEAKEVVSYFGAKEKWTYAKKANGGFEWTPLITPNSVNQFPAPPKAYQTGNITFFNALPNPDGKDGGREKITLKNNLNEVVELDNWKLINQKGKEFSFNNFTLNPHEKLTINPSNLSLSLVNKADQLSLIDPVGNLIDTINWVDAPSDQLIYKTDYFRDGLIAKVINVVDGDTLTIRFNDDIFNVRLIGVDTPETVHPKKPIEEFGKQASDYLRNLLTNQTIRLNFDETKTDKYNRLLAYVYLGDQFVNADIIKNGYGYAYTRFSFKHLDDFVKYEQAAKENGLGIWKNPEILKQVQDDEEWDEIEDEEELEMIEDNEGEPDLQLIGSVECPTKGLEIDSILPNNQKGETTEYIRLINPTAQKICLKGWQLDDDLEKGSKAFLIKGGAIGPGAMRTFRKSETSISLNNSNDCASLINPLGETVDQICYTKTHKNEIFTHNGGDWQPKPKAPKKRSVGRAAKQPTRETTDYQWELKNETLEGKVIFIYEEGEILYLENDKEKIPVSYANSQVNISMAKQMLDFNEPIKLDVRSSQYGRELIGIHQEETDKVSQKQSSKFPIELKYLFALLIMMGGFYGFKIQFDKRAQKK